MTTKRSHASTDDDAGIIINPTTRIRRLDPQNVGIETKRTGVWLIVGYYPDVLGACSALAGRHMHLVANESGDVKALVSAIRELAASLNTRAA